MDDTWICPECGTPNSARYANCRHCARPRTPSMESEEGRAPLPHPLPMRDQRLLLMEPRRTILGALTRRKLLVALLGSGAILALGAPGWAQLIQNLRVSLNTKGFPRDRYDNLIPQSFSPDLNLVAMNNGPADQTLYIWDYQQQRMTTLPSGPASGDPVWSSDNKYLLTQTQDASGKNILNLWNVQTRQKVSSYTGKDYASHSEIHWSPDSSRIALLPPAADGENNENKLAIMSFSLIPLYTLQVSAADATFTWSPDNHKLALLTGKTGDSAWSLQIWDQQTRTMDAQISFVARNNEYTRSLAWSPDGAYIAAITNGQLRIIEAAHLASNYILTEPVGFGRLAWSPDGKYLATVFNTSAETNNIQLDSLRSHFEVWNIPEQKKVRTFNRDSTSGVPEALAWPKDGSHIVIVDFRSQESWPWPS